ncbi:MAG TPA: hypothetical protein VME47_11170 [Acetobacteraceae bacterium]|nr:hypothetical protein [Acetobacteraceae bacterium]
MRSRSAADDTIRLKPPPSRAFRINGRAVAGAVMAALVVGLATWLVWPVFRLVMPRGGVQPPFTRPAPLPAGPAPSAALRSPTMPAPAVPAVVPAPPPPQFAIVTRNEAAIDADVPAGLTIFRFADDPSIVVLDFASLRSQGLMLNRVAAFVEKAAAPRDRVLNDAQLAALIRAGGDTVETFYYGHDYSAAALARFFTVADQDRIALDPEEVELHQLLAQLGWLAPGVRAGLISLPKVGANGNVTAEARRVILRLELAHGAYFSDPDYAAFVHQFWELALSDAERGAIRRFLASEEYDVSDRSLVENEMQAYLMFTHDRVFFTPRDIDMAPRRLVTLQRLFYRNMPAGWARDMLGKTLGTAITSAR